VESVFLELKHQYCSGFRACAITYLLQEKQGTLRLCADLGDEIVKHFDLVECYSNSMQKSYQRLLMLTIYVVRETANPD